MSFKKTVAIAAAAGALAAISVPAMALENEFHGSYTFNSIFSNFQNGGSGDFDPTGKTVTSAYPLGSYTINSSGAIVLNPAAVATKTTTYARENLKMNNYFEQRARLQYIAKVNDDLRLVTHFELDTRFGSPVSAKYTSTDAGKLDADGISLETKHVYLDFNLGKNFNAKTGIQPYKDTLKGLFIDADVPAVITKTTLGAYSLGLGYSRFADDAAGASRLGDNNKDLFIMDNTFAFTKDTKAAFSYYLLADYAASATGGATTLLDQHTKDQALLLHTFGLSGETKVGPLALSGFAAMQAGHQKGLGTTGTSRQFHGWAANVAAKLAVGPGTAKTALLYTSGDNTNGATQSHYNGWVTSSVNSYNESGLMILARNTANSPTSTDRYIRRNVTNIALATLGYDAKLSDKMYANGNVGFGWLPASNAAPADLRIGKTNNSDFLGTELNLEAGYKVYQNLTLRAQAAYMILGGAYKDSVTKDGTAAGTPSDPENPYTMRLLASFAF